VYPALAVADELRRLRPDAAVTFVGTRQKLESRVVPARGYEFRAITISGFRRSLSLEGLLFPLKVGIALVQSLVLLRRLRPAVVVGTGGYVSGPPVAGAWMLGIPTLLQEQNSIPGITTRLLARVATEVHVTFAVTGQHLSRTDRVHLTGTPTRAEIGGVSRAEAARRLGLEVGNVTVLVVGGSQGAASLNDAVLGVLPGLLRRPVQIIWATGVSDFPRVEEALSGLLPPGDRRVHRVPYLDRIEDAYALADLAVARAGATTLAELLRAGVPALLVPYPFAAADHQTENARTVVEAGAALMVRDAELPQRFEEQLRLLLEDPERLRTMALRARSLGRPEAARRLAQAVLRLAER
jgi:UDP-N-acetylglucosamine--N-acetylmuramyl-(pentapeptide) pyrophosphoryl-undecaprenol N-acetylglucosamine transferase